MSSDTTWRKSSYSSTTGGNCVEVATTDRNHFWRKSSHSGGMNNACVEVAASGAVLVRDTTDRDGFTLSVSGAAWTKFLAAVR